MTRLLAILALCCACGCLQPPEPAPTPKPDDVIESGRIATFAKAVGDEFRKEYLETARRIDSGKITTAEAMMNDEAARFDDAFDRAAQGLADNEQQETNTGGPWTPARASQWRKQIAGER